MMVTCTRCQLLSTEFLFRGDLIATWYKVDKAQLQAVIHKIILSRINLFSQRTTGTLHFGKGIELFFINPSCLVEGIYNFRHS